MRRRTVPSRGSGKGRRRQAVVWGIVVVLVASTMPAGSFTLGELGRAIGPDVVVDGQALMALSVASVVGIGSTDPLVDVSNNFSESITVTVTIDPSATDVGDLVVGGVNEGDTATFTIGAGNTTTVSFDVPQDCSLSGRSIPFEVVGEATDVTATADRSSQVANALGLRDSVAYQTQADNFLAMIDRAGTVTNFGFTTKGFGPADADFDCDGEMEIPYIDGNSGITIIDLNGETQTLVSSGVTNDIVLGVGDFDGDGKPAVIYSNSSDSSRMYRVEYNGDHVIIPDTPTQVVSIAGVADFNNDGDQDIIFTRGNKGIYFLDNGGQINTGEKASCTMCIGAPKDFDGDGVKRVPFKDSAQSQILLVDDQGNTELVWNGGDESLGSLGSFDWNDDGTVDIAIVYNADKKLYWIDYTDGSRNGPIQDDGGSDVQGDAYGVA